MCDSPRRELTSGVTTGLGRETVLWENYDIIRCPRRDDEPAGTVRVPGGAPGERVGGDPDAGQATGQQGCP